MSRKDSHHHGNLSCSFCGKGQREVRKLIAGPTVYICDECIKLCNDIIADESEREENRPAVALPAPIEIKTFLDDYVLGQERAKNILAFAAAKRYARSRLRVAGREDVQQALLKTIEATRANVTPRGGKKSDQQEYIQVDTANLHVTCGGAFCGSEPIIKRRAGEKWLGFGA